MIRRVFVFAVVVLIGIAFVGCENPTSNDSGSSGGGGGGGGDGDGETSGEVTESEAEEIAVGAMSSVNDAVSQALSSATVSAVGSDGVAVASVAPAATATVDYSAAGVVVEGTGESNASGDFTYDLTATLDDYSTTSGTVSGTLDVSVRSSSSGSSFTYTYDGDFVVIDSGTRYEVDIDWNLDSTGAWSGSYVVNGQSYTYEGSTSAGGSSGSTDTGSGSGGDSSGDVTSSGTGISFWTDDDGSYIDIRINGSYEGRLTEYFPSGAPDYGDPGTVTVSLPPGTHDLYAEDQDGAVWDRSFTLGDGQRQVIRLDR